MNNQINNLQDIQAMNTYPSRDSSLMSQLSSHPRKTILFFLMGVLVIMLCLIVYLLVAGGGREDLTRSVLRDDSGNVREGLHNEEGVLRQVNLETDTGVYTQDFYDENGQLIESTTYTSRDKTTKIQTIKYNLAPDGTLQKEVFLF